MFLTVFYLQYVCHYSIIFGIYRLGKDALLRDVLKNSNIN